MAGKESISSYVKLLCTQKMIYYGVSASTFIDYFPMGETTCCRCVSRLAQGLVNWPTLTEAFFRRPTKTSACNITELHYHVHKIPGMPSSLDVTKVYWENCPTALKGQFQGWGK